MSIISVHNLGKCYRLGRTAGPNTLRDRLALGISGLFSRRAGEPTEEFWALRDVSFEVQEGEVLGIIGRNGAGKSTLLKILSQITEPTIGEVRVRGRVASLLEVGTGFHGELSGRENIYLNGAILGMTKAEIRRKFDEIVAFSGVEKFLDTPVKHYSSGMKVRLAFAVAAHLEPEILLIDEVLAVGDIEFQKKCLGKMDDVAKSGRTILFVSHNMTAVEGLCQRCILLEQGRFKASGPSAGIITHYLERGGKVEPIVQLANLENRTPEAGTPLTTFEFLDGSNQLTAAVRTGEDIVFRISGQTAETLQGSTINLQVRNNLGQRVTTFHSEYQYLHPFNLIGRFSVDCRCKQCRLMPGMYFLDLIFKSVGSVHSFSGMRFEILPADLYKTGKMLPERTGFFLPDAEWSVKMSPDESDS